MALGGAEGASAAFWVTLLFIELDRGIKRNGMELIVRASMKGLRVYSNEESWTPITIQLGTVQTQQARGTVCLVPSTCFILRPISAVPASAITQQLISLANDNPV